MPEPVDEPQKLAVASIWDCLLRDGRWPIFHELDQRLYREHDLDAQQLLPQLPPGLLYGVGHGRNMHIGVDATVGLTVAGVAATGRAQQELDLFLRVVRHAAEVERAFDPPADQPHLRPVLTAGDVAELLGLNSAQDRGVLNRLGAILHTEQWGSTGFGGIGTLSWQASIDRRVRQFRRVADLGEYWELRPKFWEPDPQKVEREAAMAIPGREDEPDLADVSVREPHQESPAGAGQGSEGAETRTDVLVIAALLEEMEAIREAGLAHSPDGPGVARWEQRYLGELPYWWGEYRVGGATRFTVALARPTQMGGRVTGTFAAPITDRLNPAVLAMSGVCAGNPEETALGDVVVGSPVYEWDEGKRSPATFQGDHQHFPMNDRWLRAAQEFDPARVPSYGDATEEEALLWFLEQLYRGQQPRNHPALRQYFPAGTWRPRLERLAADGYIVRDATGRAALTPAGSDRVQQRLYDDVDGPQQLPFRVMAAPMASGSSVISDPKQWAELKAMGVRKIAAIEMEAATIATIAQARGLPWLVAKGVMDHADTKKDDRYKQFAARASAQVMFALLAELVIGHNIRAHPALEAAQTAGTTTVVNSARHAHAPVPASPAEDISSMLDALATTDPTPGDADRQNGRLFLVVHPAATAIDALAEISSTSAAGELNAAIQRAVAARGGSNLSPDLGHGTWRRRSTGMVNESGVREDGTVGEDSLLVVKVAENGQIGVICGRATTMAPPTWRPIGQTDALPRRRVILPALIVGLVHGTLRLAGDLAQRHAGYDGPWGVGLRLTGIRDAIAYDYLRDGDDDTVAPYEDDTYERILPADTAELLTAPEALTSRLTGALLRGLSIEHRYLPQPSA